MKKKLLFLFSFLLLTTIAVAFSNYIIVNLRINNLNKDVSIESGENKNDYKKVVFLDENGTQLNKYYFKPGETLTLEDAPSSKITYGDSSMQVETWTDNAGNILSPLDNGYSRGITISKPLELKKQIITKNYENTSFSQDDGKITIDNSKGNFDGNIVYNGSSVSIQEHDNEDKTKANEIILNESIIGNGSITTTFKDQDGNETTEQELKSGGSYQHTSDATIGLEDASDKSININTYKPNSGKTSNNNPCITRLKLGQDTILTSGSSLTIGARTGYYAGGGWSQFNWQGYINGSYSELDLNGKTLIVGSGATLNINGSLCDTVGSGQIIIESGAKIVATFIIEDQHHERHMPIAYVYSDAPFKMFRFPYLNANIRINKGGSLIGKLKIDLGGDGNANMYNNDINIIGDGSNFMIDTSKSNSDSFIKRSVYYDKNLIKTLSTEAISKNNIIYQKIKYECYGGSVLMHKPGVDEFSINTISIDVDWDRCDIFVPPYFDFYLYNTDITLYNNYIFYPGSYLYIDNDSSIMLSATDPKKFSFNLSGQTGYSEQIPDFYQGVGGLMFIHERFDPKEPYQNGSSTKEYGWIDDRDNEVNKVTNEKTGAVTYNNSSGNRSLIYTSTTKFWSEMNKTKPAKADIYGTINFDTSVTLYKENYHLGGEININNLNAFVDNVKNLNCVNFYNNVFDGAPNWFKLRIFGVGATKVKFNISDYYAYPLITNGNVIMDLTNNNKIRSDYSTVKYSLNFENGLIKNEYTNEYYAYIYRNFDGVYNNWVNHLNKIAYYEQKYVFPKFEDDYDYWNSCLDDLRLVFEKVNYNSINHTVTSTSTNETFIYFHGGFFKFTQVETGKGEVDVRKFHNYFDDNSGSTYPDLYTGVKETRTVKYVSNDSYYNHGTWRLNS